MSESPGLMGVEETRTTYFPDLSPSSFRHWIATGQAPPSARIGRRRYFRRAEVEQWINAKFATPAA